MPGPAAARLAKLAVKYGPHAYEAVRKGGPLVKEAAQTQQRRLQSRRHAFDKARTLTEGSVLRTRDGEEVVWVVFAGDQPVAVYPDVQTPVARLVERADLGQRATPEEYDAARIRRRARDAARRTAGRVSRRKRRDESTVEPAGEIGQDERPHATER